MASIELRAEPRSITGKKVRFLRRQGVVPANVYGHADSRAVQIPERQAEQVLARAGRTQLITLAVDGETTPVLVKDFQRHPIRRSLLHVDFYRVAMTETLRIDVPLRLVGEAPGIREFDATLLQSMTTVSAESLPGDLPEAIDVDLSVLTDLDAAIHVRDLKAPAGVTIVADPEELVAKLLPPTVERVEEPEEAVAEAEGAPETAATAGAEPAEEGGE